MIILAPQMPDKIWCKTNRYYSISWYKTGGGGGGGGQRPGGMEYSANCELLHMLRGFRRALGLVHRREGVMLFRASRVSEK